MCWFSAEHANHMAEAKVGQRLGIRQMYPHSNWAVSENELEKNRPTPVCLLDGTKVLFRVSEDQQSKLHLSPDAEAVFKMSRHPKQDIFEFSDGRQFTVDELPCGMVFDVLMVPGAEHLSTVLEPEKAIKEDNGEGEKESFLTRLFARL